MLNSLESSTHHCEASMLTCSAVDQCSIKEETFERRIAFELQFYAQLTSQSPFAVSWFLPKATGGLATCRSLETSNFYILQLQNARFLKSVTEKHINIIEHILQQMLKIALRRKRFFSW